MPGPRSGGHSLQPSARRHRGAFRVMQPARSQQQGTEAAAVVEAQGSSSAPPSPPSPQQRSRSTDTELEDRCPICLESWKEPSFVMPCLHRFCYACILQWADTKTKCPLCKGSMTSILHSVRADDDFAEHVLAPPVTPPVIVHPPPLQGGNRERDAPNVRHPGPQTRRAAAEDIQRIMGSFQLPNWMSGLSTNPTVFQTLRSWVYHDLQSLFAPSSHQPSQGTEQQHHRQGHHGPPQQDSGGAAEQEGSPSSSAPAPAQSSTEEVPSTSSTATGEGPARQPSAPTNIHREQQEPREERARVRRDPPNSTGGSHPSPRGLQRPPKRKAPSPEGSPACRRPRQ